MIDHPKAKVDKPGGISPGPTSQRKSHCAGASEIKKALRDWKGSRLAVRSRTEIESSKVAKADRCDRFLMRLTRLFLVKKIDDVRVNSKVAGIAEVRDESDHDGLRIAIELKKDANTELILNYLLNIRTCRLTTISTWWRLIISHHVW